MKRTRNLSLELKALPATFLPSVKSVYRAIKESFKQKKNIVAILPMGVVVRAIEPKKKTEDPWVVYIDENGKWVIGYGIDQLRFVPLLSCIRYLSNMILPNKINIRSK